MLSKKPTEFSTNNRLPISKMVSNRMSLHSHKVSNPTNKSRSNQAKIKCLHKTKVKFQDKKSNKFKHYKMKLKKFTISKEILPLLKFKIQTLKEESISLMTTCQNIEELIKIKII